ncbi:iron ABC transporter permease [Sinobaca sp. H24]|uniref:FecCD family ABC transporter permease n=1 Tax=Sinobaca sp. H24 TaxID=2923376 RepID=UPI002079A4FB|nr:iron ABC transporter permease [Sinobaca sp. H24]
MKSIVQERLRKKQLFFFAVIILLILAVFFYSMNTGFTSLSPIEVIQTFIGLGDSQSSLILFEFRLPRIVLALLVGACLAVSGCILQGVSRNSLADPGILGITTGAGLFVVLYISYASSFEAASAFTLPFLALIGGSITAFLIYILSYEKNVGLLPYRMILNGIAIAAGISALMTILMLRLAPEQYSFVAIWLAGRISGSTWNEVLSLLPWLVILFVIIMFRARDLDTLAFGDKMATGLGVTVEKERLILTGSAVALAAAGVSVSGGIGFVGLIAPHLARRLVGSQHVMVLPASALLGGLLLLTADTIGRSIIEPSEIPAGVVVAVIGAPYFLYLLARQKA